MRIRSKGVSLGKELPVASDTEESHFSLCYINKQRPHSMSIPETANIQTGFGSHPWLGNLPTNGLPDSLPQFSWAML